MFQKFPLCYRRFCRAAGKRASSRSTSARLEKVLDSILLHGSEGQNVPLTPSGRELVGSVQRPLVLNLGRIFQDMLSREENLDGLHESQLVLYLSFLCHSPNPEAFEQGDVSEFFHLLLDQINTELVGSQSSFGRNNSSSVIDICRGFVHRTSRCISCHFQEDLGESPFLELPVEYPGCRLFVNHFINKISGERVWKVDHPNIIDCLSYSLEPLRTEKSKGEGCHRCGRIEYEQMRRLSSAPILLSLNLSPVTVIKGRSAKLTDRKILLTATIPDVVTSRPYNLCGVIMHHGKSNTSGHYSCYSLRTSGWKHFSDTRVTDLSKYSTNDLIDLIHRADKSTQVCFAYYLAEGF